MSNHNQRSIFLKLNESFVFITQSFFPVPKEVRLNSTYYLIMKVHNKLELKILLLIIQQTFFIKILRRFTENVQANDTTLLILHCQLIILYVLERIFQIHYKNENKILEDEIKTNQAQYILDREAAKISALSKELDKYEYLAGENLGYKPGVVEEAKFEYSPLDRVLSKRLKESDKKEGLSKRLKSIEDNNEEQLKTIGNKESKQLGIDSVFDTFNEKPSEKAKDLIIKLNDKVKSINCKRFSF